MESVRLLHQAQQAGLRVKVRGHQLLIRGPASAEGLAQKLLHHKAQIVRLLQKQQGIHRWRNPFIISPGNRIEWYSPRFGVREGEVVLSHYPDWCVVQTLVHPTNLVWVPQASILKLGNRFLNYEAYFQNPTKKGGRELWQQNKNSKSN